jgi:hypothetical protein
MRAFAPPQRIPISNNAAAPSAQNERIQRTSVPGNQGEEKAKRERGEKWREEDPETFYFRRGGGGSSAGFVAAAKARKMARKVRENVSGMIGNQEEVVTSLRLAALGVVPVHFNSKSTLQPQLVTTDTRVVPEEFGSENRCAISGRLGDGVFPVGLKKRLQRASEKACGGSRRRDVRRQQERLWSPSSSEDDDYGDGRSDGKPSGTGAIGGGGGPAWFWLHATGRDMRRLRASAVYLPPADFWAGRGPPELAVPAVLRAQMRQSSASVDFASPILQVCCLFLFILLGVFFGSICPPAHVVHTFPQIDCPPGSSDGLDTLAAVRTSSQTHLVRIHSCNTERYGRPTSTPSRFITPSRLHTDAFFPHVCVCVSFSTLWVRLGDSTARTASGVR